MWKKGIFVFLFLVCGWAFAQIVPTQTNMVTNQSDLQPGEIEVEVRQGSSRGWYTRSDTSSSKTVSLTSKHLVQAKGFLGLLYGGGGLEWIYPIKGNLMGSVCITPQALYGYYWFFELPVMSGIYYYFPFNDFLYGNVGILVGVMVGDYFGVKAMLSSGLSLRLSSFVVSVGAELPLYIPVTAGVGANVGVGFLF